jgi:tetratricopeptide (TPR) repeat protein
VTQTLTPNPRGIAPDPGPPTIENRLLRVKERLGAWVSLVSLLVSVLAGAAGSYFYLNSRVDEVISARLERRMMPYQRYMAAQMLFTNDDPDRCADALAPVLPNLESDQFEDVSRSPFYDLALTCARDSTYASKYRGDVKRIEAALDRGRTASSGWHQGALGLYYLRTGELDVAERDLRKAVTMLNAEGWPSEEASAHWSLALLHLARGRSGEAAAEYRLAASLAPSDYEAVLTGDRWAAQVAQPRFRFLRDNPGFQAAVPAFLAALASPPLKP